MKHWIAVCLAFMLCLSCSSLTQAETLTKLPTAWMDAQETFPIWYAKEKGWDKEAGLDIELLYFSSGADALRALPSETWRIGAMNAIPAMIGALRYNTYVIGIANDEAHANAILVREDSPIMKVKGYNKDFPNVYGDPATVKGKTILCTNISSAHFTLVSWLKALGLTEADVTIKNMDQAQALTAFEYGIGDVVALWSPMSYVAEAHGNKVAARAVDCRKGLPLVLVADKTFADQNPETVAKFLSVYMRSLEMLKKESPEAIAPEYLKFYLQWAGRDYSTDLVLLDIKSHPVFTLDEQVKLFDTSKGTSVAQGWQTDLARFFASTGRISQDDLKQIDDSAYVTGKFLNLVKTPLPAYK